MRKKFGYYDTDRRFVNGIRESFEFYSQYPTNTPIVKIYRREYLDDERWTALDKKMTVEDAAEELVTNGWSDKSIYGGNAACRKKLLKIIAEVFEVPYEVLHEIWRAGGWDPDEIDMEYWDLAYAFADMFIDV